MLRVVLTVDCDRCNKSYEKAAVCTEPETFFWESYAHDLKECACFDGWYLASDEETEKEEIICDECVEKILEQEAVSVAAVSAAHH